MLLTLATLACGTSLLQIENQKSTIPSINAGFTGPERVCVSLAAAPPRDLARNHNRRPGPRGKFSPSRSLHIRRPVNHSAPVPPTRAPVTRRMPGASPAHRLTPNYGKLRHITPIPEALTFHPARAGHHVLCITHLHPFAFA